MSTSNAPLDDAFDRLQRLLLALREGDEVVTREASRLSGLAEPTCRSVLEGLARAGLLAPRPDGRFVRVSTV